MKGVIFDMDGVIIDSEPIHVKLERALLEEVGGDYSKINHDGFMGTTDAHLWSTLKKQFNIKLSVNELIYMKQERFIKNLDQVPLVNNVLNLMESLHGKGIKLGLASSNNEKAVEAVKNKYGLARYMGIFTNGEAVSKGKPDPEIFLSTAKYMNLEPENCIVIEDTRNGVLAAKAARMKCIGYQNKNSGDQDLSEADLIINNYENITIKDMIALFD